MKRFIPLLLLLFTLQACTDVVDLDLVNEVRLLAIDGRITDQLGGTVRLSLTAGYLEQGATPRIEDAEVYLYEDGQLAASFRHQGEGLYHTDYNGQVGRSYHLQIDLPASYNIPGQWRTAASQLQPVFNIDSLRIRELSSTTDPQVFTAGKYALMYFREPAGEGDNYRIRRWQNDSLITASLFTFDDEFIDGATFGYPNGNGPAFPAFNFFGPLDEGDSISVEVSSITADFNDYLALLAEQVFQVGGPFDAPPAQVVGNLYQMDNPEAIGYGYFVASAITRASVMAK